MSVATVSQRIPQRKRGVALEQAIVEAAWAELVESGYAGFTVESVAARAKTGKASIYRRWSTKQLLVLDALLLRLPTAAECGIAPDMPDTVSTIDALHGVARAISGIMASPAGSAMRAIKCEAATDPELARVIDERFQGPRREAMLDLLRRGVERGEVRPGAVSTIVADVLPAVLMHRLIFTGDPVTPNAVAEIVDEIFIPLISPH